MTTTSLNIFLLDVDLEKFIIGLHFLFMFSILVKFSENQRSIAISLIKRLNFEFL